ncbi:MAG: hypothetical protein C0624_02805 [Desulfuromonas sp.]|nr:MAG: hypothetical protein C0624_02805 [Desulfuromonas sp.]
MFTGEDRNRILSTVEDNNGFMKEFVEDYLHDIPQDMQNIEDAILQHDAVSLERSAHSLKSVVGLFQAMVPYNIARDMELLGKTKDFIAATERLKELRLAIAELNELLTETIEPSSR